MKKLLNIVLLSLTIVINMNAQEVENYKNKENPFDEIGQKHNDGVGLLMKIIENKGIKNYSNVINEYVVYNQNFSDVGLKLLLSENNFSMRLKGFSLKGQNYFKLIEKSIKEAKAEIDIYTVLKKNENIILKDKSLNSDEKNIILMSSAVGRYSTYYWNNNSSGSAKRKINWDRVKQIVKADLEGAGTGGGLGAAFGPEGVVIGAVGGAVIGSCCGRLSISDGSLNPIKAINKDTGFINEQNFDNKITYSISQDFTWENKTIFIKLGYSDITFEKGDYTIQKNKNFPYGKIILNVKNFKKTEKEGSQLIKKPIFGPWRFRSGFYECNMEGVLCCKRMSELGNLVKINPIYSKENNLEKIEIIFLDKDITNGTN